MVDRTTKKIVGINKKTNNLSIRSKSKIKKKNNKKKGTE
jgi:hypothetical protein